MDGKEHFAIDALWTSFKIEAKRNQPKTGTNFHSEKKRNWCESGKSWKEKLFNFPYRNKLWFFNSPYSKLHILCFAPSCYSCVLIFMKKLMVWECFEKVPESEHRGGSQRKFKVIKTKMKNKKNPWKSHLIQHESLRCEQQQARSFKVYLSWNKHQHICWGENWQKAGRWKGERRKTLENI